MRQNQSPEVGTHNAAANAHSRSPLTEKFTERVYENIIHTTASRSKTQRYQSLLGIIGALYLVILASLDFLFIRSSFAASESDPFVFFVAFSIATALFIAIGYLAFQNALADERAAAAEAQAQLRIRLVHMAAHELRNPMASIKVMVALLRRKIQHSESPDRIIPLTRTIDAEIDRLSSILNSMLQAFEAQEDHILFHFEPVDIVACVKKAMIPFEASSPQHQLHLHVRSDENTPGRLHVWGDFRRLEDIFRNLINNAIKYSPGGGNVDIRIYGEENQVVIEVSDNGVGIPADQQDEIFESFFRADNLGDEDPGGMGLGLFICREIVQKHGGNIDVESRVGEGSTLRVRLPLYVKEDAQAEAAHADLTADARSVNHLRARTG